MVQILRPDEVRENVAKGPGEWDIVNRRRTKGVIEDIRMESNMLVMDTIIGERELNFGPVASDVGGQGLKALKVEGDEVRTTWYGIAGASVHPPVPRRHTHRVPRRLHHRRGPQGACRHHHTQAGPRHHRHR